MRTTCLLPTILLLASLGCSSNDDKGSGAANGTACSADGDCASTWCNNRVCETPPGLLERCSSDQGARCSQGECTRFLLKTSFCSIPCGSDDECGAGFCVQQTCVPPCDESTGLQNWVVCADGRPLSCDDPDVGDSHCQTCGCPDDLMCSGNACVEKLGAGKTCSSDAECKSGHCGVSRSGNPGTATICLPADPTVAPEAVASADGSLAVALDDSYVYWGGVSGLHRQAKNGTDWTLLTKVYSPASIQVDNTNVLFAAGGAISKQAKGGGAVKQLATGQECVSSIALDSTSVFWLTENVTDVCGTPMWKARLMKVDLSGATQPVALASDQVAMGALAIDATYVYWPANGSILKVKKAGGTPAELVSGTGVANAIATYGGNVYWAEFREGSKGGLGTMPAGGGTPTTLATGLESLKGIAVDGSFAYAMDYHTVWKIPLGGGEPVPLAINQAANTAIAVDSTHVYWTTEGVEAGYVDSKVFRIPK